MYDSSDPARRLSLDYSYCFDSFYDGCYLDRLAAHGTMISELEKWVINQFKGNEKVMI
jgi:hypothetical protein